MAERLQKVMAEAASLRGRKIRSVDHVWSR